MAVQPHVTSPESSMSENRLGRETSPYLLQHKDNPVHWWAWGPEALAEAKRTGKPILLSVGYAACHWCHVMAHESFEDDNTAKVMNDLFVNIKVDREERPDVDAIYMSALHSLGEQGGWPMTMFLDADARPFWGGTYFPKESRWGRPAFKDVLRMIERAYREQPDKVAQNAQAIVTHLNDRSAGGDDGPPIGDDILSDLTKRMVRAVDPTHGGLSGAPKFPQWNFFWLLWRGAIRYGHEDAKAAVEITLKNICQGGIYDHLGGGFARYSVDERWLAPHFEKMLYDNALLIDLLTEVWRETHNPLFQVRIEETVAWLAREMIAEGGGFAASLDADSEGEEGKFYVWSADEIAEVLGPDDARLFGAVYDVTPDGNWEGHTILNRLDVLTLLSEEEEAHLATLRAKLFERRAQRVRPGWDDKVLADWNGLMIAALARASVVFAQPEWLKLAERAFAFVESRMTVDGRLMHSFRDGRAKAPATASDYANMIWGALRLYQATQKPEYLERATAWTAILDKHYWVASPGGYATSADDTQDVIVRMRIASDDATPSANAIMLPNLVALALITGEAGYQVRAVMLMRAFSGEMAQNPISFSGLLAGSLDLIAPQQIALIGTGLEGGTTLRAVLNGVSLPGALEFDVAGDAIADGTVALQGKHATNGRATAYACLGPQCSLPLTNAVELRDELVRQRSAPRRVQRDGAGS
jgi:uncharacterized protein YyaL (SSP411 family)